MTEHELANTTDQGQVQRPEPVQGSPILRRLFAPEIYDLMVSLSEAETATTESFPRCFSAHGKALLFVDRVGSARDAASVLIEPSSDCYVFLKVCRILGSLKALERKIESTIRDAAQQKERIEEVVSEILEHDYLGRIRRDISGAEMDYAEPETDQSIEDFMAMAAILLELLEEYISKIRQNHPGELMTEELASLWRSFSIRYFGIEIALSSSVYRLASFGRAYYSNDTSNVQSWDMVRLTSTIEGFASRDKITVYRNKCISYLYRQDFELLDDTLRAFRTSIAERAHVVAELAKISNLQLLGDDKAIERKVVAELKSQAVEELMWAKGSIFSPAKYLDQYFVWQQRTLVGGLGQSLVSSGQSVGEILDLMLDTLRPDARELISRLFSYSGGVDSECFALHEKVIEHLETIGCGSYPLSELCRIKSICTEGAASDEVDLFILGLHPVFNAVNYIVDFDEWRLESVRRMADAFAGRLPGQ